MQIVEGALNPLVRTISLAELERERAAVAKAARAKALHECWAIAERYVVEAIDREYRDLEIQASCIADAIAALKDMP